VYKWGNRARGKFFVKGGGGRLMEFGGAGGLVAKVGSLAGAEGGVD